MLPMHKDIDVLLEWLAIEKETLILHHCTRKERVALSSRAWFPTSSEDDHRGENEASI